MSGALESTAITVSREPVAVIPTAVNSPPPAMNAAASQTPIEQQMNMSYTAENAAADAEVGSSPPAPQQSIPPGAIVINHVKNLNSVDYKQKRGRPRRNGPDVGIAISMTSTQTPVSVAMLQPQPQNLSAPAAVPPLPVQSETHQPVGGSVSPTVKKVRGRPRGSSNKKQQKEASGSTNNGFTPYILNVNAGEDVTSRIMSIVLDGPRTICVISAYGSISSATLRQASTSGGTVTYEGLFKILSFSGSFMLSEVAGQKGRTGGLNISLAAPNGRVFGGCVAGSLVAATPVQAIVGSFLPNGHREAVPNYVQPSLAPPTEVNLGAAAGSSSSLSRGTLSESSGGSAGSQDLSYGAHNTIPQGVLYMPLK